MTRPRPTPLPVMIAGRIGYRRIGEASRRDAAISIAQAHFPAYEIRVTRAALVDCPPHSGSRAWIVEPICRRADAAGETEDAA